MTGRVDDQLRALVRVQLSAVRDGPRTDIEVWIDTAFNGGLTLSRATASQLGLIQDAVSEAILADGSRIELEVFGCYLDWFGQTYRTEAIATDGTWPLLGTQLLAGRRLTIDYGTETVELT